MNKLRQTIERILASDYLLPTSAILIVTFVALALWSRQLWTELLMVGCVAGFALLAFLNQRHISRMLKEQVSRQEEYLLSIVQGSVDAIIFIDNDNRVKMWNRGAEEIFGYSAVDMIGRSFQCLIPPDLEADRELGCIMEHVYRFGHVKNHQTQRLTKSGRRITVNISRTLIRAEDGTPIGSTAIIKDITDKVEMDERIYNTEKLASIGILAAGVAHEINNPLAVILGFTDLLKEKFPKDRPEYDDLVMIEENANHAKAIVQNLLGFARVSEGQSDEVQPASALETVLTIVRNTIDNRKVVLKTDIPDDLPAVPGDTREFQQVIFNLITNALAAMEGTEGTLTVSGRVSDDWVEVSVCDTGVGVPEAIRPQIFDPFFTTKDVGKGTGLGLSLCHGIVAKSGGRINFTSSAKCDYPDRPSGSTFTVSLPVVSSRAAEEEANRS